jgi:iron complex outermembrane recepter protein
MKAASQMTYLRALRTLAVVLPFGATAVPAMAQQSPASASPGGEGSAASASSDAVGLQEVVVTAQRRAENIQKSSLNITAINSETLEAAGVTQLSDLTRVLPGVSIMYGGNTPQTYIRGVGDQGSYAGFQSAVSYNIDGVYIGDEPSAQALFYDLQRVEALKGPQGTLYGRNTSAGAINIITNRPILGSTSADGTLEMGAYNDAKVQLAVNLPLGSMFALRTAVNYVNRDGYLSDGADDDKQRAGRIELLFQPDQRLSLLLIADADKREGRGVDAITLPRQPGTGKFTSVVDPINNAAFYAASTLPPPLNITPGAGLPPAPGVTTGLRHDTFVDNFQHNVSAELNYDTGFGTLTFIPAYRSANDRQGSYLAGIPYLTEERSTQKSYEVRYAYDGPHLNVIAGFYDLHLDIASDVQVYLAALPGSIDFSANDYGTRSWAPFAQATLKVTDALRLIGGLRYTREDRTGIFDLTNNAPSETRFASSTTFTSTTFRAGVEYDLTPVNMLYATVSKGFKSGGFNPFISTPAVSNVYQPETLYSYTLGVKNRFFDNRMQLNVEGFYWDPKNLQESHLAFTPAGALNYLTFNAATAKIYGADVDLAVRPTSADTFSATFSYVHARFSQFAYEIPSFVYAPGSSGCRVGPGSPGFTSLDCSDEPLPRSPTLSGSAGYEHTFTLPSVGSVAIGADLDYASQRWLALDYTPSEDVGSFIRANAHLSFFGPDDRYSATAYVNNMFNRVVPVGGIAGPFTLGIFFATVDAPTTYGIRLTARF